MIKLSSSRWLALILAAYLAVGALYAVYTPPWQTPDEPAHYNYIRALAATGQFPVMEAGDYDQAYLERVVFEKHFPPEMSIEPLRYEDWQPPLYYVLAAPLFRLTGGSLVALRLWSVLLGAGVIALAFLVARQIFPLHPDIALGAAAFVAFVPQHVAVLAGVNNDGLAELLLLAAMCQTFKLSLQSPISNRAWALLGALLGLGMITKLTCYIAAPLAAWAIVRRQAALSSPGSRWSFVVRRAPWPWIIFPALLIALPWWARNVMVYGWPDLMGQLRHNAVVAGQPTSAQWIAQYGWGYLVGHFFQTTFQSFWGQFGWMTAPMPARYYAALGVLSLAALAGCIRAVWFRLGAMLADVRFQLAGLWIIFNLLMYLYYNLNFVQQQGRYLFPALAPLGLAFTVGLRQWTLLLPRAWRSAALALPYLGLAALALLALVRVIMPAWR